MEIKARKKMEREMEIKEWRKQGILCLSCESRVKESKGKGKRRTFCGVCRKAGNPVSQKRNAKSAADSKKVGKKKKLN